MSVAVLTGQQRVERALERRDHDRVPRHDHPWPETLERWRDEGFVGDRAAFDDWLGSDIDRICWSWPVPYPGRDETIEQDDQTRTVRDHMGKVQRIWKNKSGTPEHISFGCDSRDKWRWMSLAGVEAFEAIRQLIGDEIALIAMRDEPQWTRDLSRTYTDLILRDQWSRANWRRYWRGDTAITLRNWRLK